MADLPISGLNSINGSQVNDTADSLAIADASSGETKKISRKELFTGVGSPSFQGTTSLNQAVFSGNAVFNGGTSGINYSDLEGTPPSGSYPDSPTFVSATVGTTTIEPSGYITGGAGAEFNGYVTVNGAAELFGNLLMRSNRITLLADPIESHHAATKAYVDSVAGGGGGGATSYYYDTRDDFVADAPSRSFSAGDVVAAGGVLYVYDGSSTHLPSLSGFDLFMLITPLHFGAVGNGSTDDTSAIQAMLQYLSDTSGPVRTVDFFGRTYLLTSYLYMGYFDWDQNGVAEVSTGPIKNIVFRNGTLKASDSVDWVSPWPETNGVWDSGVPSAMIYVGEVVNQSFVAYKGENYFDVANIKFEDLEFDGNFVTGGIWAENSHRVIISEDVFYNMGIDCWGVATPQTVASVRGYTPLNQQTIIKYCRFEGNKRTDGISNWPGKVDFNGGAEIAQVQAVVNGALSINGAHTSGGEFTSNDGRAYFVAIQTGYDETLTTDYHDFRDVTFTITGFADVAKTIPVTETMKGPRGGRKIEWSYSMRRYAVITSITADTNVPSTARSQVLISTDYRNGGIRVGTHDGIVSYNNMTALSYASVISGRAGEYVGNHPWSRYAIFTNNSRKMTITGNYLDFTTTIVGGQEHIFTNNGNKVGSPVIAFVANIPNDTGNGLIVKDNSLTAQAILIFEDEGANTWETDPTLIKRSSQSKSTYTGNIYTFNPGYTTFGGGVDFNGYTTVNGNAEINGNLFMGGNLIFGVATPTDPTHAANKAYVDSVAGGGAGNTDLSVTRTATQVTVASSTGTDAILPEATALFGGIFSAADKLKLNAIEANATADQTGAEIVSAINTELGNTTWQSGGGGSLPTSPTFDSITVGTTAQTTIGTNGYFTGAAGGEFNGFLTVTGGASFGGNIGMNNGRIYALTGIGIAPQAIEPTGGLQNIATSSGAVSTNGFGAGGAGVYYRPGGVGTTWNALGTSQERLVTLSGTSLTIDVKQASVFKLITIGNTTFTFTSPASGHAYGFTLVLTRSGTHSITYPASVKWAGGVAPTVPAAGQTDVLSFFTIDGGSTWYGFLGGDNMS